MQPVALPSPSEVPPTTGSDERDRDQVRRLAARLLPQAGRLADALVEQITRQEPAYAALDVVAAEDLRHSCLRNLQRIIRSLGGPVPADDDVLDAPAQTGRRRAAQGMPLEAVLHSYRIGGRLIWDALVAQAAGDPADPHNLGLLRVAGLVWQEIDRSSSVLAEAYREEERRRETQHRHQQQADVTAVLDGRLDDAGLTRAADRLGLAEGCEVLSVVVLLDDPDVPVFAVAEVLARHGVPAAWAVRAGTETALVRGTGAAALADLLRPGCAQRVGISPLVTGLRALPEAHHLAELAARALPAGAGGVLAVADGLPEVLVAGAPELAALLLAQTVDPVLAAPDGEQLLATVAALLRCAGSFSAAAEELFCHRNTVIHRVRRVAERSAHDPTTARGQLLWSLALLARVRTA